MEGFGRKVSSTSSCYEKGWEDCCTTLPEGEASRLLGRVYMDGYGFISHRIGTISIMRRTLTKTSVEDLRATIPTDNNLQCFSRPPSR